MKELQMTRGEYPLGAPSTGAKQWDAIKWRVAERQVKRLQMRIAKAVREKRYNKAKALQWLLTHSFSAKVLAVKRVTHNKGGKTPGVDGVVWKTSKKKMQAVQALKRKGYKPQPLRRIEIPKKNGKLRALHIPVMKDRAMQALHLLALEPVAEMQADKSAYGFRPKRCTADAIAACFNALARKGSAQWIFEGDIQSCFDKISHSWLLEKVLMDKEVLAKWLTAGFMKGGMLYPTETGVPQGGNISPVLLTITLSGLEQAIKTAVTSADKAHLITYADDFIVTGASKEVLERKIKPIVEAFLGQRGLVLSPEKSKITTIDKGFEFLGFELRKYKGKFLIKPTRASIKGILETLRKGTKKRLAEKTEDLIRWMNPRIRGWSNYYRHVTAKQTFQFIDHQAHKMLWQWAKRRHPHKPRRWIAERYFRSQGNRRWIFSAKTRNAKGETVHLDKLDASTVAIKRHVKIRAVATPYDPAFTSYFRQRANKASVVPPGQRKVGLD